MEHIKEEYISYRENHDGTLILSYVSDETNQRYEMAYMFYSFKEALSLFKEYLKEQISKDLMFVSR